MELQSESDHAEAEEQRAVAVCHELKQGERVQEAAKATTPMGRKWIAESMARQPKTACQRLV